MVVTAYVATLLLTLPQPAGAQDLAARFAKLQSDALEQRAELARTAYEQELFREAGYHAERVLAQQPKHKVAEVTAKIKGMNGEAVAAGYKDALRTRGSRYRRTVRKALRPIAKELVSLASDAEKAGDSALTERVLLTANSVDSDNDRASKGLRKLGYDVVFNYGVIPKDDKIEARKMLQRLGGGFLGRRALADELEYWGDAWGLQTRHYRFVTNADHKTVFAFARACEDLFAAWHEFARGSKSAVRKLSKPCTIYFFDSRTSYEIILRVRGGDPSDSESTLGFYAPATKIGFFYGDRPRYGDDLVLLFETFYHEGSHQLFDLAMKSPWKGNLAKHELHWVEEGFCCYLESLVASGEGRARSYEFGQVLDDDLGAGARRAIAGKLKPLSEFVHMNRGGWDEYDHSYSHATLLVHFLLHARKGSMRQQAFKLLLAEMTQGGLKKKTLFEILRVDAEDLDKELRSYAETIVKELTARKYR